MQPIPIPRERLTVSHSRSGGPGGQNVNKVASRVEIRFALGAADWIPPPVRARLAELFPNRITREGEFHLFSSRFRDQPRNLEDCLEKLAGLLRLASERPRPRVASRPTRSSKRERLRTKRRRKGIKEGRRGGADEGW